MVEITNNFAGWDRKHSEIKLFEKLCFRNKFPSHSKQINISIGLKTHFHLT